MPTASEIDRATTGPAATAARDGPARVLGLPLARLDRARLLEAVDDLIRSGGASYVITANLNYAMLTDRHPDLRPINAGAAFVVADGMPLVWMSRLRGTPLPGRVAGSDLVFDLSRLAAERGYGLFLLGAAPGVADRAAANLRARYPGLRVVGVESPPFREPTASEEAALIARIREARPDILIVCLGQPKGERWIARHVEALGVPLCIQLGASVDFAAGRVRRAPRWMQAAGLEWAFRLALEPRRLAGRYLSNGLFLLRHLIAGGRRERGGDT